MEKFNDLNEWSDKQLRTIRNNLNNRLTSFKNTGGEPKELQKSHKLFGLTERQCQDLLKNVLAELKKRG
jgi:hypothetical protein